jgi:iron-binding CDGSH zinc finger protein
MAVTTATLKNGPYEIAGGALDPLYLCRCGQSRNKPFCDGSHKDAGFTANETAKSSTGMSSCKL